MRTTLSLLLLASAALTAGCARPAAVADPAPDAEPVYAISEVDAPPHLLDPRQLWQKTPNTAARLPYGQGAAGTVTVAMVVGRDGRPREVAAVRASSWDFGPAAEAAAKRMRFEPARLDGAKVPTRAEIIIRFGGIDSMVGPDPTGGAVREVGGRSRQ